MLSFLFFFLSTGALKETNTSRIISTASFPLVLFLPFPPRRTRCTPMKAQSPFGNLHAASLRSFAYKSTFKPLTFFIPGKLFAKWAQAPKNTLRLCYYLLNSFNGPTSCLQNYLFFTHNLHGWLLLMPWARHQKNNSASVLKITVPPANANGLQGMSSHTARCSGQRYGLLSGFSNNFSKIMATRDAVLKGVKQLITPLFIKL